MIVTKTKTTPRPFRAEAESWPPPVYHQNTSPPERYNTGIFESFSSVKVVCFPKGGAKHCSELIGRLDISHLKQKTRSYGGNTHVFLSNEARSVYFDLFWKNMLEVLYAKSKLAFY